MLSITSLVLIYFITGSLYLVTTFRCPLSSPLPLVTTNLISYSMSLFGFEVLLTYSTMLVPITQHSDSIFLYIQNDHHNKSSCHLSPYKDITLLLTIFPTLNISYLWLIYFVTGSSYFLISFTYFSHPPSSLPSGNHPFVLCIYDSVPGLLCWFICLVF